MTSKRRSGASARTATLPLAGRTRGLRAHSGWLPSPRSLASGAVVVALLVSGCLVAWRTPVFAIRTIEVEGAPPALAQRVRTALSPLRGTPLVAFDKTEGRRLVARLPAVASAHFDRAFPNTLRVVVTPERPVALLRRGRDAWVVSGTARVLRRAATRPLPALPRVWLSPTSEPIVGSVLSDPAAETVRALVPVTAARFPVAIRSARLQDRELLLTLVSGLEVNLGSPSELRLKLAVVARVLPLAGDAAVVDASVPDRVVAGLQSIGKPQVDD